MEAELTRTIRELAVRNGRPGYCRITLLVKREGWKVNRKRVQCIWKGEPFGPLLKRPRRGRIGQVGGIVKKAEYTQRYDE